MQFPPDQWEFLQEHGSLCRVDCEDARFYPTGIIFPNLVEAEENLQVVLMQDDQMQVQPGIYSKHKSLVGEIVNNNINILPPASAAGTGDVIFQEAIKELAKEYDQASEMPSVIKLEEPFLNEQDDVEIMEPEEDDNCEIADHDGRKDLGSISRWQCTGLGAFCSIGMTMATLLILTQGNGQKLRDRIKGKQKTD